MQQTIRRTVRTSGVLRPPLLSSAPSARFLVLSTLLGLTAISSPTLAQEAAEPAEAEAGDGEADGEAKPEVEITDKARSHFKAGVNLLQDPDGARYEEAYAQFKAAYAESPSWKILSNLGLTAMKLEKDGEAIDAFKTYLEEGGDQISEAERAQTQRDLDTLQASVVTLTITASPEGVKLIDERITNRGGDVMNQYAMPEGELTLRVRPGTHKITARLNGYEDSTWEFTAAAASSHEHSFELQKPAPQGGSGTAGISDQGMHRPVPASVWVGLGVTGAFTAGAVVTGVIALGKNGEYDDANLEGDPEADDLRKGVKSMNLVTDMLIGGAVAAGAVTTILYVTRPSVPKESAFRIEPIIGPEIAALSLSGKF